MELSTPIEANPDNLWAAFRVLYKRDVAARKWHSVKLELEQLWQLPMLTWVSEENNRRLLSKSWVDSRLQLDSLTLQLLQRLLGVFMANQHFTIICRRFDCLPEEGLKKLGVEATVPLMIFWAHRRFPHLSRKIFNGNLKRHFSTFRNIPPQNFTS